MKWIDINEIAIELTDNYQEVDPRYIIFTDLHKWIIGLEDFEDEPNRSNEQILEAIQMAWIEELE